MIVNGVLVGEFPIGEPDSEGIHTLSADITFGQPVQLYVTDTMNLPHTLSNTRVYDGCSWDLDHDGGVGIDDFAAFRRAYLAGGASIGEFASFRAAFGDLCPITTLP